MCKHIIRTDNLSKNFGKFQAVQGIDLKVPEGDLLYNDLFKYISTFCCMT